MRSATGQLPDLLQCEAYCSADALFVAPLVTAVAPGSHFRDVTQLEESGLLGGYRREFGW
ncbi:hypothetical protein AB0D42_32140 [Streptomyces sp. NPDC048304]|uniref:hypothetical protein n=1 Tax=Streptomyces sp. NPDC048304 TaxID=3154820 RepID=UPI0033FD1DB4